MKSSTFSDSLKTPRRGRPPKATEPKVETEVKAEKTTAAKIDKTDHENRMQLAQMLIELETQVQTAKLGNFEWLEVDASVIKHFCKGEMPACGYIVYKDIRLCLEGAADAIIEREGLSTHAIVFKEEAKQMTVGTTRK